MWAKIASEAPRHPKILAAAKRLGKFGRPRAFSMFGEILCYCAEFLTDGFFPNEAISTLGDPDPAAVLDAFVAVGWLYPEATGYRVHHHEEHNPSASKEKLRRADEASRKREARARKRHEQQLLNFQPDASVRTDAGRPMDVLQDVPEDEATDVRQDDTPDVRQDEAGVSEPTSDRTLTHAHTRDRVRARDPVPSRPVPSGQGQDQRSAHRVLVPLAHSVIAEVESGLVDPLDVPEELKARAAKAHLPYDRAALGKAQDAAEFQRRRRRQG